MRWEEQRKTFQQDAQSKAQLAQYNDELARKRVDFEHEKGRQRNAELVALQEDSTQRQEQEKRRAAAEIEADRRATDEHRVGSRPKSSSVIESLKVAGSKQHCVAQQLLCSPRSSASCCQFVHRDWYSLGVSSMQQVKEGMLLCGLHVTILHSRHQCPECMMVNSMMMLTMATACWSLPVVLPCGSPVTAGAVVADAAT